MSGGLAPAAAHRAAVQQIAMAEAALLALAAVEEAPDRSAAQFDTERSDRTVVQSDTEKADRILVFDRMAKAAVFDHIDHPMALRLSHSYRD